MVPTPHLRIWCLAALTTLCALQARAARPAEPIATIPLASVGYQPVPPRYLAAGGSMFTLNYLGDHHLLFTFNSRTLMARLPDATAQDDDRNVTAVLLELPSGKVLARTEWRTRDHDRYLWPLAHGRFLLRIRTRLSVIDPLANLASPEPFRQQAFLDLKRRIGFINTSPDGELLAIQTLPPSAANDPLAAAAAARAAARAAALAAASAPAPAAAAGGVPALKKRTDPPPASAKPEPEDPDPYVDIRFFRMGYEARPGEPDKITARAAGTVEAAHMLHLVVTGEGFISVRRESAGVYLFDYESHAGKKLELAPFETSCAPRAYWISRSEFVAFGCRGGEDKLQLSDFNLRGDEPWVQVLSGQQIAPYIIPAPAAGRFALSRVLVSSPVTPGFDIMAEQMTAQEISILQSYDGRQLLKLQASPIQRAGQNFDLSADGLSAAVIHNDRIEIYRLPPLNGKDEKEIKLAAASEPERNDALVHLNAVPVPKHALATSVTVSTGTGTEAVTHTELPAVANGAPDASNPAPVTPAGDTHTVGDAPVGARKAPSLYDADHPRDPKDPK